MYQKRKIRKEKRENSNQNEKFHKVVLNWDLETSGSDFSENGFTSTALRRATVPVYTHVGDTVNGKTGMERVQLILINLII